MTKVTFIVANPYPILSRPPRVKGSENLFDVDDDDIDDGSDFGGYSDDDDDFDYSTLKLSKAQESCVEDMNTLNALISNKYEKLTINGIT